MIFFRVRACVYEKFFVILHAEYAMLYSNPSETAVRDAQIYPQKTYCPVLVSRVPNTLNNVSAGYILS